MAMKTFEKHPDAILDYGFNLSRWLTAPEIISNVAAIRLSGDIVVGQTLTDGQKMSVMLSAGTDGSKSVVRITGQTNSNPARTFARTFEVFVTSKIGPENPR